MGRWPTAPQACVSRTEQAVSYLTVELDQLSAAERRDLANALLRAAWSAVLQETRVALLDLLVEVDDAVLEAP